MASGKQVLSDEVRRTWRETLNEVEHQGAHVTVLRYSTPAAVIVPVSWYEAATAALETSA
jgi:prevent-host-death family protein